MKKKKNKEGAVLVPLTEDDWKEILSPLFSFKDREVLETLKKRKNDPINISRLYGTLARGRASVDRINKLFREKGIPYRISKKKSPEFLEALICILKIL